MARRKVWFEQASFKRSSFVRGIKVYSVAENGVVMTPLELQETYQLRLGR